MLGPAHHAFWGKHRKLIVWNVDELVLLAPPAVLAMIPDAWYETVQLDVMQRAVVTRDGRPVKFLRPDVHRIVIFL